MKKTILLGLHDDVSPRWRMRLSIFVGIINVANGIRIVHKENSTLWFIMGLLLIVSGIVVSVYGYLAFSEKSRYAPRVAINDKLIFIKEKLMKHAVEIPWDHIDNISFAPYKIVLKLPYSDYVFSYRSASDASKEIKSSIREMAESKQIKVTGG